MQPMNYTIKTFDPGEGMQGGFDRQVGLMTNLAQYQKAQELATAQQIANEQAVRRQQKFAEVAANPTSEAVQRLMIEEPTLSEGLKRSFDTLSETEKAKTQELSYSVLSALEKGKPESATQLIDMQIEAAKNSEDPQKQKRYEMLRNSVIANPNAARFMLKGALFSTMGGDKYAKAMKDLGEADTADQTRSYDVRKAAAEASKAETDAGYAAPLAQATLEDKALERRIKVMEVELKKTDSETKRQELQIKIDEAKTKRDESMRTKTADVESARSSIDNFLNTADRLTKNPMLSRVLGPIEGRFSSAPLSDEAADAVALIDTLKSQAFLSQIPSMKGTGALSEKEGAKLESALTNLSRVQSEKQFMENLEEAKKILLKARKTAAERSGVPDDKANPLDRLLQKYVK